MARSATYTLLYAGEPLGTIVEDDADFPTLFGTYELDPIARERAGLAHVLEYIDWSVRTWPLVEQDRVDELAAEEEQFAALIESEQWALRAADGRELPILIPAFCTEGRVNWRYALRGPAGA